MSAYWILKTEPSTYSFQDLERDQMTNWDGVRNFRARNFLKAMKKNDRALIYHSGDEKAVIGLARVVRTAYPDPDPRKKGDWVQVDIKAVKPLRAPVTLKTIKEEKTLQDLLLVRQGRLSVVPVGSKESRTILKLCGLKANE